MGSFATAFLGKTAPAVERKVAQAVKGDDAEPESFKRGGKVRKTGKAKVHKGERVLTKRQAKKYEKKRG